MPKQKEIEISEDYEEEERRRREREKEKEQKEKKKKSEQKVKTISREKKELTPTEGVKIPILEKSKPAELKENEIDSRIPEMPKEKLKITVPVIELEKPSIEVKQVELDRTLPNTIPKERKLAIPIIKLDKPREIIPVIKIFNNELPKIRETKKVLSIPIYRASKPGFLKEVILSFDSRVDAQILQNLVSEIKMEKERNVEKVQTVKVETVSEEGEPSGGGEYPKEEFDFDIFKYMFGISKKNIFEDKPKIISVEQDDFLGAVEYICLRIYREIKGGKPETKIISNVSKEMFKREIESWMKAENRVFSVEFKKDEELDKDFWESVADRVEELFGQGVGFIVTNEKLLQLLPKHHIVDFIDIKIPEYLLSDEKLQSKLCSFFWGLIDPELLLQETKKNFLGNSKFDYIFEMGRRKFEEKLKDIARREPYNTLTKRHRDSNESNMHYQIKVFVVKYIADVLGLKGDNDAPKMANLIHTEKDLNGFIPDIYVDPNAQRFGNEVFEIKTLFGEGEFSLKKIDETIEKYEKMNNPPRKVNIVLENLTLLMHLNEIKNKIKIHKNKEFEVEVWTLDIQNNKLISLENFIKKLKKLYMPAAL